MENQITSQFYYETQNKLETVIKNFMETNYGSDYENKLIYTYHDWDLFSTKEIELGKTFLLIYPIHNIEINNDSLKEVYNNDYSLSEIPFSVDKIFDVSEKINQLYLEISK